MSISIISCMPGDHTFALFTEVREKIYTGKNVAPENINMRYLISCVVAMKDRKPVGRLCMYDNPYLQLEGQKIVLIGNFECIDDIDVVNALVTHTNQTAHSRGAACIVGPMNGSTWDDYRLPIGDRNLFFTGQLVYPEYYSKLFTDTGFNIMERYYTSISDIKHKPYQHIAAGVTIRDIDMQRFEEELRYIYPLMTLAMKENVLYSPIDEQGFIDKYLPFASYISSRYVLIAEDAQGIVAFMYCYPDVLYKEERRLVSKTFARHPNRKYEGLIRTMINMLFNRGSEDGYAKMIHAFSHEDNRSRVLSQQYDGELISSYALFIKPVTK